MLSDSLSMKSFCSTVLILALLACFADNVVGVPRYESESATLSGFRAPAVPLVVVNPYLSIWQFTDELYGDWSHHWSGPIAALTGFVRVNGTTYRFLGGDQTTTRTATQLSQPQITATRTLYPFSAGDLLFNVTFLTPPVAGGYLYRFPVTYISIDIQCQAETCGEVLFYFDTTAEIVVSDTGNLVSFEKLESKYGAFAMKIGTSSQSYFSATDDRINWGYWTVAVNDSRAVPILAGSVSSRTHFVANGSVAPDNYRQPRACSDDWPVMAFQWNLGEVTADARPESLRVVCALNQSEGSIMYFGEALHPSWTRYASSFEELLFSALDNYIVQFEAAITNDIIIHNNAMATAVTSLAGERYAQLCNLAYRQVVGATVSVWNPIAQDEWIFMKEISSDGDVSTVDVLFPSSPFWVWMEPDYLRRMLLPILAYANNETLSHSYPSPVPYNLPWAPHHLGVWPVCNLKASQQEQMPMEESGNMMLMIAAIGAKDGNYSYLEPYWDVLKMWANDLLHALPDPGDQLCTDDFEGPSPHNVNLAMKGMSALSAYAKVLNVSGRDPQTAAKLLTHLKQYLIPYLSVNATSVAPNIHMKRQYNLQLSWSLKYNAMYDQVLQLNLFPVSLLDAELESYRTWHWNTYGVPLDDRAGFTKGDWLSWIASFETSTDNFNAYMGTIYRWATSTPDRIPLSDWYDTKTARSVGFRARPVWGALWARQLRDQLRYSTGKV